MPESNNGDFFTVLSSIATAVAAIASLWAAWTSKITAKKAIDNANELAEKANKAAAKKEREEKIRWLTDLARDNATNFNKYTNDKGNFVASENSIAQFYYSFASFINYLQKSSPNEHERILNTFWVFLSSGVHQEIIEGGVLYAFYGRDQDSEEYNNYGQIHIFLRSTFLKLKKMDSTTILSKWNGFKARPLS